MIKGECFEMKEEKTYIAFTSFPDYTGNSKAIYEKIKSRSLQNVELIWFVKSNVIRDKLKKAGINVVCDDELEFESIFEKVKILFITHDQYIYKKKENQIFICLWHGLGPKRIGYLNKGKQIFEMEKNFLTQFVKVIDYFITPSEFFKIIVSARYNMNAIKILEYPFSRNEYLSTSNGKENLSKLLNIDLNQYKKIFLYAPTYRKAFNREEGSLSKENLLNLQKYSEEELKKYLKKHNYLLVLKLHPSESSEINQELLEENIVLLKEEKLQEELITLNEILNAFDILLTDYSSIYIDYLLLQRPILFLDIDLEEYEKARGIIFDNKEFWFPGPAVFKLEDLKQEIKKSIKNKNYYKNERRRLNDILNQSKNKGYEKIIDEFILNLI